jgi:molybdopterin-guanine dinucleotide biosynthesis protein A
VTSRCSAIVLAGGKSSRLGQDKRALRLVSARTQLEETVCRVAAVSTDVVVVVDSAPEVYRQLAARVVTDERSGAVPLGGLCAGLVAIRQERALVVACDLPFLSVTVLRSLVEQSDAADLVVPRRADGTLEMLHAIYRKTCLGVARRHLATGQLRLADLVPAILSEGLVVRLIDESELIDLDPELRSFVNVNTPQDLRRVHALFSAEQST